MKKYLYIMFFAFSIVFANIKDSSEKNLAGLTHYIQVTYETTLSFRLEEGFRTLVRDNFVNTSILEFEDEYDYEYDNDGTYGIGLRYGFFTTLVEGEYKSKYPLFAIGSDFYINFMGEYIYGEKEIDALSYGVIPQIKFLYFMSLGYGFGMMKLNASYEYGDYFELNDVINSIFASITVPVTNNLEINASYDYIWNKNNFKRKWTIKNFRFGIGFRF